MVLKDRAEKLGQSDNGGIWVLSQSLEVIKKSSVWYTITYIERNKWLGGS